MSVQVQITLTPLPQPESVLSETRQLTTPLLTRSIVLSTGPQAPDYVLLGRASRDNSKRRTPAAWNGYFLSPNISRHHANIYIDRSDEVAIKIFDRGSLHGTFRDGERIRQNGVVLNDGDTIVLGAQMVYNKTLVPAQRIRVNYKWLPPSFSSDQGYVIYDSDSGGNLSDSDEELLQSQDFVEVPRSDDENAPIDLDAKSAINDTTETPEGNLDEQEMATSGEFREPDVAIWVPEEEDEADAFDGLEEMDKMNTVGTYVTDEEVGNDGVEDTGSAQPEEIQSSRSSKREFYEVEDTDGQDEPGADYSNAASSGPLSKKARRRRHLHELGPVGAQQWASTAPAQSTMPAARHPVAASLVTLGRYAAATALGIVLGSVGTFAALLTTTAEKLGE